jgi:osmoprotectant transport system permease protein
VITTSLVLTRLGEHLSLTLQAVLLAAVVVLPIGLALGHARRGGVLASVVADVTRAVPTYGVLILFSSIAVLTRQDRGIVLALALFAAAPLLTTTVTGMLGVDREVVDAARGLGMSGRQVLLRVELPLALPSIAAGVRTAVVQVIATATLATYVGAGGLGTFIQEGYGLRDTGEVVQGALLVAGLAVLADLVLAGVQGALTPGPGRRLLHRTARV